MHANREEAVVAHPYNVDIRAPIYAVALLFVAVIAFALLQNYFGFTGGPISAAKTLWLSYALQVFLVVPCCLWLNPAYSEGVRRIFGAVFLSFAIRGIIELYILYFTQAWKCGYGISHDLFTFALAAILFMYARAQPSSAADRRALMFLPILFVTLLVECFMAWQFSLLASPAEGIYFADNTAHFRRVNLWSWMAVGVGYPALLWFVWSTRHDFHYESQTFERSSAASL